MDGAVRVILADDVLLVREALADLLTRHWVIESAQARSVGSLPVPGSVWRHAYSTRKKFLRRHSRSV